MDDLLEFILELFLEGTIELSTNKKVSKWVRYPLIFIISILFLAIIFLILYLGIWIRQESIALSIAFIILSIALLFGGVKKFKQLYYENKEDNNNKE